MLAFSEGCDLYYIFLLKEMKGMVLEIMLMVSLSKRDLCNQIYRWSFLLITTFMQGINFNLLGIFNCLST